MLRLHVQLCKPLGNLKFKKRSLPEALLGEESPPSSPQHISPSRIVADYEETLSTKRARNVTSPSIKGASDDDYTPPPLASTPLHAQNISVDTSPRSENTSRTPDAVSLPLKRKLGPIPKKRGGTAAANSATGTPARTNGSSYSKSSLTTHAKGEKSDAKSLAVKAAKKSALNIGTNDMDLRDPSTYKNIFGLNKPGAYSKAGGSAARPTVSISVHK